MTRLERMLTIRLVEDRLQKLCFEGLAGDLHFSKGQEAISVGVCAALRETDYIVTHHRTIAHEIAREADLHGLIAEVLGRKTGFNGGRAGEMHISNPAIRHAFSFQLVGTCLPVAAGFAWAQKYHHKTDDIVAVFFGDAASSNAQAHEGLTLAAVRKVPLLLICENNELAGNIRPSYYLPTATVGKRMAAYGIEGEVINGNDLIHVEPAAVRGADFVRSSGRPYFIEAMTTRLCFHKQGQGDARPKEELAELAKRDPLLYFGEAERSAAIRRLQPVIDEAFDRALSDPFPEAP